MRVHRNHIVLLGAATLVGALSFSVVGASAQTSTPAAPIAVPLVVASPAAYRAISGEVNCSLSDDVLAKWFPAAVDTKRGGYHQNYATDWSRSAGDERSIVYQSRLTWLSAQAAERFPNDSKRYIEYSKHGLAFLRDKMWDRQNGGLYWELDGNGVAAKDGEKHAYGIAFAIYAACANYKVTRDPSALSLAQNAFAWLEKHAHDGRNGGYYEALRRDGTPILQPPSQADSNDFIGTRYGFKSMNTHIHLLEALAELQEIAPQKGVRRRLREVFEIVRDKIAVTQTGTLRLFFTPNWRAVPDADSFGHDIETAYLLVEAARVLGEPEDLKTWLTARNLVDHTLDFGHDQEFGGFYDEGSTFRSPTKTEKVWWVQAEALNALLLMHTRYGGQTPRYWNAFVRQWQFIRAHQIDAQNGGWRQNVTCEGEAVAGQIKSDKWTEGYHQGRALLNVSAMLANLK